MSLNQSLVLFAMEDKQLLIEMAKTIGFPKDKREKIWRLILQSNENFKEFNTKEVSPDLANAFFGKSLSEEKYQNFALIYQIVESIIPTDYPQFEGSIGIAVVIASLFPNDFKMQQRAITIFLTKFNNYTADSDGIIQLLWLLIQYHDPQLSNHLKSLSINLKSLVLQHFYSLFIQFYDPIDTVLSLYDRLLYSSPIIPMFILCSIFITHRNDLFKATSSVVLETYFNEIRLNETDTSSLLVFAKYIQQNTPTSFSRLLSSCLSNNAIYQRWEASKFDGGLYFPVSPTDMLSDKLNNINIIYVDGREENDYNNGHINNSILLKDIDSTRESIHWVLYFSGAPNESESITTTVEILIKKNIKHISVLGGGYSLYHKFWTERSEGFNIEDHTKDCQVCRGVNWKNVFKLDFVKKEIKRRSLSNSLSELVKDKIAGLVSDKTIKEVNWEKKEETGRCLIEKVDILYESNIGYLEYNSIELSIIVNENIVEEIFYDDIDRFSFTGKTIFIHTKNGEEIKFLVNDSPEKLIKDIQNKSI
ncbi:hypothetical protein ENUP19_0047G0109 [Entamoeba nuttalli]|uniref:TBC1 domain family member 23 n=2 Tax=Entamoeba nuttalli TaxID=412467 RepID=K2H475_ENTNP|nr:hypothetical protein ENU1_203610 [Entamoeba nuttalli P19]EKE37259.1 hypothetical protein ENU1_203610 [Entamoeba nuttalli P19]|eukprot:XP_008860406.1 hypothetical protein ENU1_203610 [Entamoeba nuttalli P19]